MNFDLFAKESQAKIEKVLKIGNMVEYVFNVQGHFEGDDCQLFGVGQVVSISGVQIEVEVLSYYSVDDEVYRENTKHYHPGYVIILPTTAQKDYNEVCWNRHIVRII